jgi:hypothetical protein
VEIGRIPDTSRLNPPILGVAVGPASQAATATTVADGNGPVSRAELAAFPASRSKNASPGTATSTRIMVDCSAVTATTCGRTAPRTVEGRSG